MTTMESHQLALVLLMLQHRHYDNSHNSILQVPEKRSLCSMGFTGKCFGTMDLALVLGFVMFESVLIAWAGGTLEV